MASAALTQARLRKNPSLSVGGLRKSKGQDTGEASVGRFRIDSSGVATPYRGGRAQLKTTRESVADRSVLLTGEVGMRFVRRWPRFAISNFVAQLLKINRDFSAHAGRVPRGIDCPTRRR